MVTPSHQRADRRSPGLEHPTAERRLRRQLQRAEERCLKAQLRLEGAEAALARAASRRDRRAERLTRQIANLEQIRARLTEAIQSSHPSVIVKRSAKPSAKPAARPAAKPAGGAATTAPRGG